MGEGLIREKIDFANVPAVGVRIIGEDQRERGDLPGKGIDFGPRRIRSTKN